MTEYIETTSEEVSSIPEEIPLYEEEKIIQLILDKDGIPTIQSSNVNMSEILGSFELAKEIVLQKRVQNPNLKQLSKALFDTL